jgi:hypothetical protein
MKQDLTPLALPPGVYRNGTEYQAVGRWYDCNLMRWFEGTMRPIGGWVPLQQSILEEVEESVFEEALAPVVVSGVPRAMRAWRAGPMRDAWLGVGTHTSLMAFTQGTLHDITPAGLTPGIADSLIVAGAYGAGVYGGQAYGVGNETQGAEVEASSWQLDTFGDFLVGVLLGDGILYYWDPSTPETVALPMDNAPTDCVGIVVTPERHVVALGAGGDGRRLVFASRETLDEWDPLAEGSTAGGFTLEGKGLLMAGRRGRSETLIWTEDALWALRFSGGILVYGLERVGEECGPVSRHSMHVEGGQAIWMGQRAFFRYDGFVSAVPCEVSDDVFRDFNYAQRAKVVTVARSEFGEVTWYYPSALSQENDRYVTWNSRENHWAVGVLSRTAGVDRQPFQYPVQADATGTLYEHEREFDYEGDTPFAESGPIQVGAGGRLMHMSQLVPDEANLGQTRVRLFSRQYPTGAERAYGPFSSAEPTPIRVLGRQVRLRIEGVEAEDWRVGIFRYEGSPGPRR